MRRGSLVVAILHVAIVSSLGGKLLFDRATRPRVWARAAPVDPDLPIRGRYVRLALQADPVGDVLSHGPRGIPVSLEEHDGRLAASWSSERPRLSAHVVHVGDQDLVMLDQPVAYFLPEHVSDPSRRPAGEELWVEVTIPKAGGPRPIRLGVRRAGVLTPLDLR